MLARPALLRHSLHLRAPPPTMEEQLAEEDETLEAVKIAGGLSAACIGFYTALTYGGVDDTLAGNLVLLALVAFGSYLLFFDGGATQAALEMQAVQEVCGRRQTRRCKREMRDPTAAPSPLTRSAPRSAPHPVPRSVPHPIPHTPYPTPYPTPRPIPYPTPYPPILGGRQRGRSDGFCATGGGGFPSRPPRLRHLRRPRRCPRRPRRRRPRTDRRRSRCVVCRIPHLSREREPRRGARARARWRGGGRRHLRPGALPSQPLRSQAGTLDTCERGSR